LSTRFGAWARQSQASAGTREGLRTDHLLASLIAHEKFTGLVSHQNRLILPASARNNTNSLRTRTRCRSTSWNKTLNR
jgi:hypothetical protein